MDSKSYRTMATLLWLALPLTAFQFWRVWNELPARMASHFGAAGQPNGWMSRETLAIFFLVLLTFLLTTFTWALTRVRKPDALAWSLLAMFYVVAGVLLSVNSAVLKYNLYGRPLNILPELVVVFIAAFVVTGVALGAKRGPVLPRQTAVADLEEVHASLLWALLFAALTAIELAVIAVIPLPGLRLRNGPARAPSARSYGVGLERFSLSLHRPRSRNQHPGFPSAIDPAAKHQGLRHCALESSWRLRGSRNRRAPRVRLGQHRRAHHALGRRGISRTS